MNDMDDDPLGSSWFSKLFGKKKEFLLEQNLSTIAYEEYRRLLLKARPEIKNREIHLKLPQGEVVLSKDKLKIKARDKKTAEKILRNLHHYEQPPSLWPAYGLSYSLKKHSRPRAQT